MRYDEDNNCSLILAVIVGAGALSKANAYSIECSAIGEVNIG